MAVPKARTIIRERYQLESMIGEGGMASVWRARDLTLARSVAVKLLFARDDRDRSAITSRFLREARIAASVQHRNVIQIVDFGTTEDELPFMVMELLEGEPLSGRMHRERRLPIPDAVQLANLTLRGLAAVHNAGIIHRDLKPDNIYLKRESDSVYPKILDFGISRSVEPASGRRSALTTREGMIIGTPEYMSPEQARGVRDIDPRADLYSMGVILYECLTGQLPFHSVNVGDLIIQVVTGTAPTVHEVNPDIPIELSQVIERAMARKREDRFSNAGEMQSALLDAAARSELRNAPRMLSELPKFDSSESSGTRSKLTPSERVTLNDPDADPDSLVTGRLVPLNEAGAATVLELEPESRRPTTDGLAAIPPATKTLKTSTFSMRARAARHRYALPLVATVALVYVVLMLVRSLGRSTEAPLVATQPHTVKVAAAGMPPEAAPEASATEAAPDANAAAEAASATENVEVVVGDDVEIRKQAESPAAAKARARNRPTKLRKTAQGALRNLDF